MSSIRMVIDDLNLEKLSLFPINEFERRKTFGEWFWSDYYSEAVSRNVCAGL